MFVELTFMATTPFEVEVKPDWEGFVRCLRPGGKGRRVHVIELFLDREIEEAICDRYGLLDGLDRSNAFQFERHRSIALRRMLGFDYVHVGVGGMDWPMHMHNVEDSAELGRKGGRSFMDLHAGPITNWQQFEAYPWPDLGKTETRTLEWYQRNLPEDMCMVGGLTSHFCELLTWLMGYETLCLSLYDQPDLVRAVADRILEIECATIRMILQFDRVKAVWGSDDMGFRSGTLISPDDLRRYVLPGHREAARLAHEAGRPYLLHSCGNIEDIMGDLMDDVKIDAKHSFEDTIAPPEVFMRQYGDRVAVLGGIDVDFLCRADEKQIRRRVRQTLEACMPRGGYCLGTGNSVTNYIPVENYLVMLDEGRRFAM